MSVVPTTIVPQGRFSLRESIEFGFGPRAADPSGSVMRMAFVLDGLQTQAGVVVADGPDGAVEVTVEGVGDPDAVTAQVARILSLDVDATGWDELSDRDPLLSRLTAVRPGMRPVLFHSAYEALAWSVLSARRPRQQMSALRDRLSAAHGATFVLAGQQVHAFPTPEQLLAVDGFPGLPELKLHRLHDLARAAADGVLNTAALRALDPDEASARVQRLDGVGPFYASLVVLRALGHTDVPPAEEPLSSGVLGELLGRSGPVTSAEFLERAEAWRPWRTWAAVFVRAAGPRLLPPDSEIGRKSTAR